MKPTITLVLDDPKFQQYDWFHTIWKPEELAQELTRLGLAANVWIGRLEEAPESWAYILFTKNQQLPERVQQDAFKARLSRTLGTDTAPQTACRLAEQYGFLGVIDEVGCDWFGSRRADADARNALNVKRTLAEQLKWPIWEINSTASYASTQPIAESLPKMIATYLDAALKSG